MKLLILFIFTFLFSPSLWAVNFQCEEVDSLLSEINDFELSKTIGDTGKKIGEIALELEDLKKSRRFLIDLDQGDSMSSREDVETYLTKFFGPDYKTDDEAKRVLHHFNTTCSSQDEKEWNNCLEVLQKFNVKDNRDRVIKTHTQAINMSELNLSNFLNADKDNLEPIKKYFGIYYLKECDKREVEEKVKDLAKVTCGYSTLVQDTNLKDLLSDLGEISFLALLEEGIPDLKLVKESCSQMLKEKSFTKAPCELLVSGKVSTEIKEKSLVTKVEEDLPKEEVKREVSNQVVTNKVVKPQISNTQVVQEEVYTESSYSHQTYVPKKKKSHWLKTAAIITGAVGAAGVGTYFLVKALKRNKSSSVTVPETYSTSPVSMQNYYNPNWYYGQNPYSLYNSSLYPRLYNLNQYNGYTTNIASPYTFDF